MVSAGRRALLLPGEVKRFTSVLGGPRHLPWPVVRAANLDSCSDLSILQIDTFLLVSLSDRSGMFSDGFFSYGIEPVYNRSTQVSQLYC